MKVISSSKNDLNMKKTALITAIAGVIAITTNNVNAFSISESNQSEILLPLGSDENNRYSAWPSYTITQKKIKQSGAKSIPEAMKLIPGFVNARPFGSYELAVYGGLQDEYPRGTRIEVNDVPVNLASTGSVFWESMPVSLEDVQSITFISAPSSSINGDQAFNGVIKIYTFSASEQTNEVSFSAANKSYKRGYVRVSSEIGEDTAAQISLSREVGDGKFEKISSEERSRIWASINHQYDVHNEVSIDAGYGYSHDDKNADEDLDYIPNYGNRKISSQNLFLTWNNNENGNLKTTVGLVTATNEITNKVGGGAYLFDIDYFSLRKFASLEYKNTLNNKTRYRLYGGIRVDEEDPGKFARTTDEWNTRTQQYSASIEHDLSNDITIGGAASHNIHSIFNEMNAYSLSAVKRIDEKQTVSGLYSQGFRFPVNWESRSEHYLTAVSNPNLFIVRNNNNPDLVRPEKVENFSIKYDYHENDGHTLSATLFHKKYKDLIFQHFVPYSEGIGLYFGSVLNRGYGEKINTTGVEIHGVTPIGSNQSLLASYVFNDSTPDSSNKTDVTDSIPRHVLTLMHSTKLSKSSNLNLVYNHVSGMNWIIDDSGEEDKITKSYSKLSVEISKCYSMGDKFESLCANLFATNLLKPASTFYDSSEVEGIKEDLQAGIKVTYQF